MCGITGILQSQFNYTLAKKNLKAMAVAIQHRGPDDYGSYEDRAAGFTMAHRRLAIQDLSDAGAQPMVSSSGRYVIAFNGEIYNFLNLKIELENEFGPLTWKGHSDTEVLLASIAFFGLEPTLNKVIGMFAIALWDTIDKVLYLVRDRFGEKPLYYFMDSGSLAFSSELKSLVKYSGYTPDINTSRVGTFLRYGYLPGRSTLLNQINKLRPAHFIKISLAADGILAEEKSYWSYKVNLFEQSPTLLAKTEALDRLALILTKAVQDELVADVGVGAFLSGGIDSSLICSIVAKRLQKPLTTFSIGFFDKESDEAPYARAIAKHLGTEHNEHYVNKTDIFNLVESIPEIFDEQLGDSSVLPTYLVCKMARQHVTVALSGDGGDELFGGYNHYRWGQKVVSGISVLPWMGRGHFASIVQKAGYLLDKRSLIKMSNLIRESRVTDPAYLLNASFIDASSGAAVCNPDSLVRHSRDEICQLDTVEKLMAIDLFGYLPDDILYKVDRAAMSVGLETRAPFLNHHVAEFAWQLPNKYKANGDSSKLILRELLSQYIPRELFERPKQGFGLPLDKWFRKELRLFVEKNLGILTTKYDWLVSPSFVHRYWSEHLSGKFNWQREIWTLIALVMFLETYF